MTSLWPLFAAVASLAVVWGLTRPPAHRPVWIASALLATYLSVPNRPPYYIALYLGVVTLPTLIRSLSHVPRAGRIIAICATIFLVYVSATALGVMRGTTYVSELLGGGVRLVEATILAMWIAVAGAIAGAAHLRWSLGAAYSVPSLLGLGQLIAGDFILATEYPFLQRLSFPAHADANYTALYLLLPLAGLTSATSAKRVHRYSIAFILFLILLTQSRTGLASAAVIVLSGFLLRRRDPTTRQTSPRSAYRVAVPWVIATAITAVSAYGVSAGAIVERTGAANVHRLSNETNTLALRLELWATALEAVEPADWLLGRGIFDAPAWSLQAGGPEMTLHSFVLTQILTLGLPLFTVLTLVALVLATEALRDPANQVARFGLILMAGYVVMTLTLSDEVGLVLLTGLLTIASARVVKRGGLRDGAVLSHGRSSGMRI